jgi:acyl-[acyl carrier protein]--UDP-N-acetylglucosamine O-acyltransferase
MPMNRQLLESANVAQPLAAPANGLDEIVIPFATAQAIIERDRTGQEQNVSSTNKTHQAALEAMPHVVGALTAVWGYHECSSYLRKLMVVDTERGNRQGFSREAFDELAFLYRLIHDNGGTLIEESIPKIQRDELKHRERLMQIESAYLRRS